MFKVKQKLNWCRDGLIRWSKVKQHNARKNIDLIIQEMAQLQTQAGCRDWGKWRQLKTGLDEVYKQEEDFWWKKSRISWLREGDKNTKFFHAATAERRKRNRIELIQNDEGTVYRGE